MTNRVRDAIGSVHAEEALKRSTKAFLASKASAPVKHGNIRWMAAAFACIALALLGFGGWQVYMTPVAAISVDVNPSIELGVNRFDRIVSVEGYNEDGIEVVETVDIKNMTYSDALNALLQSDAMKAYIGDDGFVYITVIGSTTDKSEEMLEQINACTYASGPNVECQCGNSEEVTEAREVGLSFGKYRALLQLQALDPSVTADDVRNMTMCEIRNRIEELSGEQSGTQYGNGSKGNDNGMGSCGGRQRGRD